MIRLAALTALLAAPALAETATLGPLTIERPQIAAAPEGAPVAGGYLLVINSGDEPDRLVSASTPAADEVQFHEMAMEDGVMRMRAVEGGLPVPAGGSLSLEPGGLHLMLMAPEALGAGEARDVTLAFERAGEVTVPFAVEPLGAIREGLEEGGR